ncbi:MAG: PAS domain S-box protein [Gammaproteobacteria bacterium]|nr:PAS domain S-box protein [Gammaproteobacteria bacterium]
MEGEEVSFQSIFDIPTIEGEQVLEVSYSPYYDKENKILGFIVSARNISARIKAELELQESEHQFHVMADSTQDALLMLNNEGNVSFWNKAAERIFGYERHQTIGKPLEELIIPDEYRESHIEGYKKFKETGKGNIIGKTLEMEAIDKSGTLLPIELSISAIELKGEWHAVALIRDISDRKKAQDELNKSIRALQALSSCNEILVHSASEFELVQSICEILISIQGYSASWVGFIDEDSETLVRPIALSGIDKKNPDEVDLDINKLPGWGLVKKAIMTGEDLICDNNTEDEEVKMLQKQHTTCACCSSITLLLKYNHDRTPLGILHICSKDAFSYSLAEVSLLKEMAADMAYGIHSIRMSAEKDKSMERLSDALINTIEAIAITVEKRDPYTAGHMHNVELLAVAIAKEMGLTEDRIKGLQLGASIHDIGKIYIPAEILNRPGKLSAAEFEMIKTHSLVGYEIVQGIKFPWPVAEMIIQHHERLDGSGYPNGLKGEQIILEAQILSVADVVEAITSHRPYRPALGLDKGIEIIEEGKGKYFNPEVVDVCVKIIKRGDFSF